MRNNEVKSIRRHNQRTISKATEKYLDSQVKNMQKCPEKADEISRETLAYIKENITDKFCQAIALLFILSERCCLDLPNLDNIVNDCRKNISGIKTTILHDFLVTKIDQLLTGYNPFN